MRSITARFLLQAARARLRDGKPFILSHLVTNRCNADCLTCLWKEPADAHTPELSTAEIERLYEDAAAAGFVGLVVWGGEPTLRRDLGAALAKARAVGLSTTLITNGYSLPDRAQELLPNVNRLIVSVDGIGETHDRLRRCPGLYRKLSTGLFRARRDHPATKVFVTCVLSKPNLGELEGVASLGRALSARVIFQSMNFEDYGFAGRSLDRASLELSKEEERDAFARIAALGRQGYPVRNSSAYMARFGAGPLSYRCHYKKVVCRVESNGDILDCTRVAKPMCNVGRTGIGAFLEGEAFREFVGRATYCNRCRDVGVLEVSHIWEGKAGAIANAAAGLFDLPVPLPQVE